MAKQIQKRHTPNRRPNQSSDNTQAPPSGHRRTAELIKKTDQITADIDRLAPSSAASPETSTEAAERQHLEGSYYQPERAQPQQQGWFRRNRRRMGIVATLLTTLGTAGFFFLSGPLQFIHASKLLQQFHFAPVEDFGDDRSGKFLLYALAGKTAQGRLGTYGNHRAERWDARLAENGLRPLYSAGTQRGVGYEIIDQKKARPILEDLRQRRIDTDAPFQNPVLDINSNRRDGARGINLEEVPIRRRSTVTRQVTQRLGTNKISSALGARLLNKRAGTDGLFHPLKNIVRQQTDDYATWRQKRKDERANRALTGDSDVSETRLARLRTRISEGLRTARGPAIVAFAVCGTKDFSASIDAQNTENQLTTLRMGVTAIAEGEQVMSGEDFSAELLGVINEQFYDPETKTSWLDDPGIQSELGKEPTGRDFLAEKEIKPGSRDKPVFFEAIDGIPTPGIPGIGDVCDLINFATSTIADAPVLGKALESLNGLFDGAVRGLSGRSSEEWLDWARDYFATGGVNREARGAEWGGIVNVGTRLAANEQMKLSGGRELTPTETIEVKQLAKAGENHHFAPIEHFAAKLSYRLQNPSDLVTLTTNFPDEITELSAGLLPADRATAQASYDYGFPLYGFSLAEQEDPEFENPFANGNYFADNPPVLDEMNQRYGKDCFGITISQAGDLEYSQVREDEDLTSTPAKCRGEGLSSAEQRELLRYRFYIADIVTVHALDCHEGDEVSCSQLGLTSVELTEDAAVAGLECPANLSQTINVDGTTYYQMPEAPNGEYTFDPGAVPSQRYGKKTLVCVLYTVAKAYDSKYQGQSKLDIGDLNASGHDTHNQGIAADLNSNGALVAAKRTVAGYSKEATVELGKLLVDTKKVRQILWCPVDSSSQEIMDYAQSIGQPLEVSCVAGHEDHFHVVIDEAPGPYHAP